MSSGAISNEEPIGATLHLASGNDLISREIIAPDGFVTESIRDGVSNEAPSK